MNQRPSRIATLMRLFSYQPPAGMGDNQEVGQALAGLADKVRPQGANNMLEEFANLPGYALANTIDAAGVAVQPEMVVSALKQLASDPTSAIEGAKDFASEVAQRPIAIAEQMSIGDLLAPGLGAMLPKGSNKLLKNLSARSKKLMQEQLDRGEVLGALERGRLKEEQRKYAGVNVKFAELENQKNRMLQDARQIIKDRKEGKIAKEEADNWIKENYTKYQDFKEQLSALATKKDRFRKALEQDQNFTNLDDVEKARLDRAVQQGFNIDAFHGTKGDIESFDPGLLGATTGAPSARRGFFFSADPETANYYARAAEGYNLGRSDQIREAINLAEKEIQKVNLEAAKIDIEARKKAGYYEKLNDLVNKERAGELLNFERQNKMEELDRQMAAEIAKNPAYLEAKAKADQLSKDRANIPSDYGMNIMPIKLRLQNPLEYDFGGQSYREVSYHDLLKQAQEAGNDGAIFRNTTDGGGVTDIYVVFEPEQIRSRFAMFDPEKTGSKDILASAPPVLFPLGVGAAAASYNVNQQQ